MNESIGFAVFLPLLIGIGAALVWPLLSSQRAKDEKGLTPLYEDRCIGGGLLMSRPWYRRVSLYEDFLVESMLWLKVIRYQDVHSISLRRGLFSKRVALEYKDGLFEGTFYFFAKEPEKALAILKNRCPSARAKDVQ